MTALRPNTLKSSTQSFKCNLKEPCPFQLKIWHSVPCPAAAANFGLQQEPSANIAKDQSGFDGCRALKWTRNSPGTRVPRVMPGAGTLVLLHRETCSVKVQEPRTQGDAIQGLWGGNSKGHKPSSWLNLAIMEIPRHLALMLDDARCY